jgi:hypothetical protein
MVACSDLGDPYVYKADCDRSTGSMDFGDVALGHFSERTLRVANSGNLDLKGELSLSDPQFTVVSAGGAVRDSSQRTHRHCRATHPRTPA